MPLQINFVEIGFEITIDPNTPRKQGQYVRGLFRLLEYMKDKTFIESDNIRVLRAALVLNRWGKCFYIPTCYFHCISIYKERNVLEILICIHPYGTIRISMYMNSEGTIHHIIMDTLEDFFSINYLALEMEIRAKPMKKKRLSWWNT